MTETPHNSNHAIAAFRRARSLTQAGFAEMIGTTKATVSRWESGDRRVDPARAMTIEAITRGQITRAQLRPDIFGDIEVTTKATRATMKKTRHVKPTTKR